jgi:hypothetical protein
MYCHELGVRDYQTGYGFVYGFTDHLYIPLGTTGNYKAIAELRILQFTVTQTH